MKNLVKIAAIALFSLFYVQANAQSLGLKAGLNLSNMLDKDDDTTYSQDYEKNPGFHIGATIDVPVNGFLSFESGLLITSKGIKFVDEVSGAKVTLKANLYYFDIPFTLKASCDVGEKIKMFGAAGPYVDICFSGRLLVTAEYQGEEETVENSINLGNHKDEDVLKRPDMGFTFGGGFEFYSITIGISYDLGLYNIATDQDNGTTVKNRVLKFSIGCSFGN